MLKKFCQKVSRGINAFDPYFGVDPDSEVAGRLRAAQIAAISRTTPLMMLAAIFIATFSFVAFYQHEAAWFMPYWTLTIYSLAALGVYHTYQNKRRGEVYSASPRAYFKATKVALIAGGLWAFMACMLYPNVPASEKVIIIAIISGMMGGGAMSLYSVPRALFVWVFVIAAGCIISLLQEPTTSNLIVLCMVLVYSIALTRAGYTMAKNFTKNILDGFELSDQSETIGLLLKDFSENASDWLWEMDHRGKITRGMDEFSRVLEVNFNGIKMASLPDNVISKNGQILNMRSLKQLRTKFIGSNNFRDLIISSSGIAGNIWVSLSGKPLYDTNNNMIGFRGVASDITDAKNAEQRIAYLAHNDALTGLVNRENFSIELETLLKEAESDKRWSVFYLDLDGFKSVNDTHGHAMGDKLLGEVALLLKKSVADSDIVARLGGDEFAILSLSASTVQSTSALAERILENVSKPISINSASLEIGISIGITLSHRDGNDAHTLMNNADIALYRAKADGRGRFCLYEHEMDEIIKERRSLEVDLKNALRYGQLSLSFQPLVSAKTAKTVSFEALVRWHHPERGTISPADFIPIAERMGIIAEIGDWVISRACEVAAEWPEHLKIAVNLSPQQFQSNRIVSNVLDAIQTSGLSPNRLELEITEGLFMENTNDVMFALRELKSMGISIALDDFGTGYSSLSYLLKFPFDKLKIDRSLIVSLETDENAINVLEAITKLGTVMGLEITAEGIETVEQVNLLKSLECTQFQGFLFGKPLGHEDLSSYLLHEFTDLISEPNTKAKQA